MQRVNARRQEFFSIPEELIEEREFYLKFAGNKM